MLKVKIFSYIFSLSRFDISEDQLGTIYRLTVLGSLILKSIHLPATLKRKVNKTMFNYLLLDNLLLLLFILLLDGPDNCGKSVCLLQIIHYCLVVTGEYGMYPW